MIKNKTINKILFTGIFIAELCASYYAGKFILKLLQREYRIESAREIYEQVETLSKQDIEYMQRRMMEIYNKSKNNIDSVKIKHPELYKNLSIEEYKSVAKHL